jgi:hypothetical protein
MPDGVAVRILGLWLEGGLCSSESGRVWGCSILAASHLRLRRILPSKLGPFSSPLGALASRRGMICSSGGRTPRSLKRGSERLVGLSLLLSGSINWQSCRSWTILSSGRSEVHQIGPYDRGW